MVAIKQAAPGGIVITARCIRPAICCRSRSDSDRRVSNSRSIATYACCLRSLSVCVRLIESHQKPKASCTCAAARSLISLMKIPNIRKKAVSATPSWSTKRWSSPMSEMLSTYMGASKVKTISERAIPITTSVKKIFHVPGRPALPKSPHTCKYKYDRTPASSPACTSNQINIMYRHSRGAIGSNGKAESTSDTRIKYMCRRKRAMSSSAVKVCLKSSRSVASFMPVAV
eukprot:scaffold6680_cov70-Phaeocystis_antarctica.AAC.2